MRHVSLLSLLVIAPFWWACSSRGEVLTERALPSTSGSPSAQPVLVVDDGVVLPDPAADVHVSAGSTHACAVVDGRVYCWGANEHGELGTADGQDHDTPTAVASDATFRVVSAGYRHTCALDDRGEVHCWGDNARGQLGIGDRVERSVPQLVSLPGRATSIEARYGHSCAILADARLYCWGTNDEGQLGQGGVFPADDPEALDALRPVQVPVPEVRQVTIGQGHTCAVALTGALYCWGRNTSRELGGGDGIQHRSPVPIGSDVDWLQTAAGQNHTCALRDDETLWCWGLNTAFDSEEGAPLGVAEDTLFDVPTRVGTASDFVVLSTDTFHTCAVQRGERMWCWGRNVEGQLGVSDTEFHPTPTQVPGSFVRVSAGRFFTCAITAEGQVACSGANESGQLGLSGRERRTEFSSGQ